jgi:hypothetical protein
MYRRFTLTGLVCLAAALLAGPACSDDDSAPTISIENVEDEYLNFYCQTVLDCDMGWAPLFESVQECRDFMVAFERGRTAIGEVVEAVQQGNADYSPTQGARCLSDLEELGCEVFVSPDPESCWDVFAGTGVDEDSCRLNDECESGWCDTRDTCPGQCAEPVADGGDCANDEQCDFGLVCFNDVCEPHPGPLTAGQPCDPDLAVCAHGNYCDDQAEVCTALKAGGEDCDPESDVEQCDSGMACIESTCTVLQLVENQGDACNPFDGQICDPLSGLGCVIDFSSQPPVGTTCEPFTQLGETCVDVQNQLHTPCDDFADVYCDFQTTRNCESKKAGGATCEEDNECLSDSCQGTPGECEPEPCWQQ